jgi:hypothetical protein
MVNGWEETGMDIQSRAERSIQRQQEDQQDAVEDRAEEAEESVMDAVEDWEANDQTFQTEFEAAEQEAIDSA